MGRQHFLVNTVVQPQLIPPERWLQAFPDGLWSHWGTLQNEAQDDDTVWVSVQQPDWISKVRDLAGAHHHCHVIVLSLLPYEAEGLRAINAGARGYCHQLAVPEMLSEVAQAVGHGGIWLGPELVQRLVAATHDLLSRNSVGLQERPDLTALSEREAQVARVVAEGKSNKEVAGQLHISERTVKAHLGAVFEKLGVRDRVQLVLLMSGGHGQQN